MKTQERQLLDAFIDDVRHLKIHRSSQYGPSRKKPLLLLLVLARIARGELTENRIRLCGIEDELSTLIRQYGRRPGGAHVEEPFSRLATARFWDIHIDDGGAMKRSGTPSAKVVRASGTYASLDPELYELLKNSPEAIHIAIDAILETWIAKEEHAAIMDHLGLD